MFTNYNNYMTVVTFRMQRIRYKQEKYRDGFRTSGESSDTETTIGMT